MSCLVAGRRKLGFNNLEPAVGKDSAKLARGIQRSSSVNPQSPMENQAQATEAPTLPFRRMFQRLHFKEELGEEPLLFIICGAFSELSSPSGVVTVTPRGGGRSRGEGEGGMAPPSRGPRGSDPAKDESPQGPAQSGRDDDAKTGFRCRHLQTSGAPGSDSAVRRALSFPPSQLPTLPRLPVIFLCSLCDGDNVLWIPRL
ncbi:unnamed protein product [Boreogadus saida]